MGNEKESIEGRARKVASAGGDQDIKYETSMIVRPDFGEIGGVFVSNEHRNEVFIKDIILDGLPTGKLILTCKSWVAWQQRRLFFTNKASYLPFQTPGGLKRMREAELVKLRGTGEGERRKGERIYDYDLYNDLGQPDKSHDLARPVIGGKERPYPRRCRTGRPRCKQDRLSETRSDYMYVPRDEEFSEVKVSTFSSKAELLKIRGTMKSLQVAFDSDLSFPCFPAIDSLFNEGINLFPTSSSSSGSGLLGFFPALVNQEIDLPGLEMKSLLDKHLPEWPLKSELDPGIYGEAESAITKDMIEQEIKGFCSLDEALEQKKLFILDYYDLFLPFVSKVRRLGKRTLYGSRTIFFLNPNGTLRPLAIELTRPPMDGKPQWKRVFRPSWDATGVWLWRLAKANVLAQDFGLRAHCCTEPYIIAANRHLSAMHPIHRLLRPHFQDTLEINAIARQTLINAGGTIEQAFSPGKYCLEISSAVYDKLWRFDHQALPKDLISRGMAVEDPTAPHGLKLTIEDYPYANDGLILWDAIKEWVTDYVNHYYPKPEYILSDNELQAWWNEVRNVGHGDKKDKPWWPKLNTPQDLIEIATTIIWIVSGHHAAVNFAQYGYGGYFPNRPTITRIKMPVEDPDEEEWKTFMERPEEILLETFPSQLQAASIIAALSVLSEHSPDEEYIGQMIDPVWEEDPVIKASFERFQRKLMRMDGVIDERNANEKLLNRHGAGIIPYNLLRPFSSAGVTGEGVPCSVTI
ncbi:hypothetical protein Tsubulata_001849 [Turnera subulata]|uniref:Lipoxygenase n=1 Tax=Turnera subulata TaxID=218843 RepID=A0A9Q0FFZ2_9ROSI|nr:hypothetical protein Tsubulata_001849 [Turnera subulata]